MNRSRWGVFLTAMAVLLVILAVGVSEAWALHSGQCLLSGDYFQISSPGTGKTGFDESYLDHIIELFIKIFQRLINLMVRVVCAIINEFGVHCTP